jgi:hypothetical protein
LKQLVWYFVLCWIPFAAASGQDTYSLRLISDQPSAHERFSLKTRFGSPDAARRELAKLLHHLHENAYLAATVDRLEVGPDTLRAYLSVGGRFRWAELSTGNVPRELLEQAGWDPRRFRGTLFSWKALARLETRLQRNERENGYPFAVSYLDSLVFSAGDTLAARLVLDRGSAAVFAPLVLGETDKKIRLSKRFLQRYLGLRPGRPYDESRVAVLSDRLRELPYLEEAKPAALRFVEGRAVPYLWLRPRKASRFDFVLGIQPAPDPRTGRTNLNLTGNALIDLHNALGGGEHLHFEWQQLRPGSQRLDVSAVWPYVLGLPLGFDGRFHLFRRDTQWLDLAYDAGAQYLFTGADHLRFFFRNTSTVLLSVDKAQLLQTRRLPEALDLSANSFGLEATRQRFDFRFNPTRGHALLGRATAGFRSTRPNNLITSLEDPADSTFRFASLYDSLPGSSAQFRLEGRAEGFFPLFRGSTLRTVLTGGAILSPDPLFRNELYRIGGNKLLRGFDEESLFASAYAVGTLEYRLLTGGRSYFFVFGDFAFLQTAVEGQRTTDFPIGFGAGLALETKAGIFGLTWALGARKDSPVQFGQSKIHFGYVNVF